MTNLERLIKAHTEGAILTTISSATEKIAEEMAVLTGLFAAIVRLGQ